MVNKANRFVLGVSHLYLCQMHIDHNSPAAGWFLGVARQAHRGPQTADRSVDQIASSLCEKTGQFHRENE